MMSGNSKDDSEILLSLSDFKRICRKSKNKILVVAAVCSLLGLGYGLSRPLTYLAEASFRERPKAEAPTSRSLTQVILTGNPPSDSSAVTTIKSRKVMERVVQKLGLQASVVRKSPWPAPFRILSKQFSLARQNLKVEYARLMNRKVPAFEDPKDDFYVAEVLYEGEIPHDLNVEFIDEEVFEVREAKGGSAGSGKLGQPFAARDYRFTLLRNTSEPLKGIKYGVTLLPRADLADKLTKKIKVAQDYHDKTLITLKLTSDKRHGVADQLNRIMEAYQEYLMDEHHRLTNSQVEYLQQRQNEMDRALRNMMVEHADYISTTSSSIDALLATYQAYKKRLLGIDLEVKHLQKVLQEGSDFYDRYTFDNDSPLILNTLAEIRQYKQQCDSIDLALRNTQRADNAALSHLLKGQMAELEEIRRHRGDAEKLYESLDQECLALCPQSLHDNPKYMVKIWYDTFAAADLRWRQASPEGKKQKKEERDQSKASLRAYLASLIHLLGVHEKTLNDRLVHQQNLSMEFQGIDLDTAKGLYLSYMRDQHEMESQIAQYQFIIDQIQSPNFEVSSLTTILTDMVSKEIIVKASALTLLQQDHSNRTNRELDRIRQDIDTQKGFLNLHLDQMAQMLKLRQGLFQNKIHAVQNVMLDLFHQKVSILEKHLQDCTLSRIRNLQHEREVLIQHQEDLKKELERFPKQWAAEKLINQHLETNMALLSEISKMIESKNISDNLEVSLSSPLDRALPPIHPNSPHLIAYMLLGGLVGSFAMVAFLSVRSIIQGVEASSDNLEASGQHVAGELSSGFSPEPGSIIKDNDLNTLRRLAAYLCPPENLKSMAEPEPQSLLVMTGRGPDFSRSLAELMAQRGLRVLVMEISFDQSPKPQESPGLFQYLQGQAEEPKILQGEWYDAIAAGGISRFSNELVESRAFHRLLQRLLKKYDWVIAISHAGPSSVEALTLLKLFNHAALVVKGDKLLDIKKFFGTNQATVGKKVSFVVSQG